MRSGGGLGNAIQQRVDGVIPRTGLQHLLVSVCVTILPEEEETNKISSVIQNATCRNPRICRTALRRQTRRVRQRAVAQPVAEQLDRVRHERRLAALEQIGELAQFERRQLAVAICAPRAECATTETQECIIN